MKAIFLKSSLPIATMLLAAAGALISPNEASSKVVAETGWVDAPTPCTVPIVCPNTSGPICTALYQGQMRQVFGKHNPQTDTRCEKVLLRD